MRLVEIFSLLISNNESKVINVKDVHRFIPKTEYNVRQIITILIEESKIVSDVYFQTKLELSKAAYYGYSVISTKLNDWLLGQSGIHAIYDVYSCYDNYSRYEKYKDDLEKYASFWVNRLVNVYKFKASTVVYVLASLFRAYGFILKTDESYKQYTYKCSIEFILCEWQELKPIGNINGYSWETGKYSYGANLLFEFQDWQYAQEVIMNHYPILEPSVNGVGSIYPVMESSAFQEIKKGNRDEYKKIISKAIGILMNHSLYNFEGRRNINLIDFISNGIVNIVEKTNRLLEGTQIYRHLDSSVSQILKKSYIQSVSDSQLVNYDTKFILASEKIFREISKFEQENEYMPTNEELADRIDWPIEDVEYYMKYSPQCISMDWLCSESRPFEMDEAYIYETLLEDKCTNRALCEDEFSYQSLQIEVDRVLCRLKNRDRHIVMMYYGIGYEPMTLSDIASKFDFSRERIRQIIEQVIKKLKGRRSWCLKPFLGKSDFDIHSVIESNYKYKALTYDLDQIKKAQKEKREQERLAKKERLAQRLRLEQEKQEQERLARKEELAQRRRLEQEKQEQERLARKEELAQRRRLEQEKQEQELLARKEELAQRRRLEQEKQAQERLARKEELAQRRRLEQEKQAQERLARKEELAQRRRLEQEKQEQERVQERLFQIQKEENESHVQRVLRAYQVYQEYQKRIAENKRHEDARSVAKIESQMSGSQVKDKVYYKVKCAEDQDEELIQRRRLEKEKREQERLARKEELAQRRRLEKEKREQELLARKEELAQRRRLEKEKREQELLARKEELAQRRRLEQEKQEQERLARKEELAQRRRLEKEKREQERLARKEELAQRRRLEQEKQEQERIAEDKRQEEARSVAKIESQMSGLQVQEKVYYKVKCAENLDEELEQEDFDASRFCNDGKDIASKTILNGHISVVATEDAVYLRLILFDKIVKLCDFHIGDIQDFCVWITQSPIEKEKYKIDIAALFKNIILRVGYISVGSDIIIYYPN